MNPPKTRVKPTGITYSVTEVTETVRPQMLVEHLRQQDERIAKLEALVVSAPPPAAPAAAAEKTNGLKDGWYWVLINGLPLTASKSLRRKSGCAWYSEDGRQTSMWDPEGKCYAVMEFIGTEKPKPKALELPDGWYALGHPNSKIPRLLVLRDGERWLKPDGSLWRNSSDGLLAETTYELLRST